MASLALSLGMGAARGGPAPAPALVASRRVDFHLKGNSFSRWKYRQVDCFVAASEAIRTMLVADGDGFTLHYDPAIALPIRAITPEIVAAGEAILWHSYDRVKAKTLLLRGVETDVLSSATALAMTQRGPRARLHEFAGIGHAPTLQQPDQVALVRGFLLGSAGGPPGT